MSKRPLAILTEGMLSESQVRALTLLSLGWIEVVLAPTEIEEIRKRRKMGVVFRNNDNVKSKKQQREEMVKADDEEILTIIRTFMQWQN